MERTLRREGWLDMPREGAIIFRDLVGNSTWSTSRARSAAGSAVTTSTRLIERYGIDAKLFEWSDEISAGLPAQTGEEFE
jgi:hypothetical protein